MHGTSIIIVLAHLYISHLALPDGIIDHEEAVGFQQSDQLIAVAWVVDLVGIDISKIESAVIGLISEELIE